MGIERREIQMMRRIALTISLAGIMLLFLHCPWSYGGEKPSEAEQHFRQAKNYERTGQLDLAIQEYKIVIELDPKVAATFYNLGRIYSHEERWSEAIEAYSQVVALDPSDGETEFMLSVAYGMFDDSAKALEHYQRSQALGFSTKGRIEYRPLDGTSPMVMVQFSGTSLTDNQVRQTALQQIEKFRSAKKKISQVIGRQLSYQMFETIDVAFLGWKGHRTWFEMWTNKPSVGAQESYSMEFTLGPGGKSTMVDVHTADLMQ